MLRRDFLKGVAAALGIATVPLLAAKTPKPTIGIDMGQGESKTIIMWLRGGPVKLTHHPNV